MKRSCGKGPGQRWSNVLASELQDFPRQAAKTLAGKALALLQQHDPSFPLALDRRELFEKLKRKDPVPPQWLNFGQRDGLD
jgi:hypothetical protein